MRSRYLQRLEAQLLGALNVHERACLQAEIAAYHARHGDSGKARELLDNLRATEHVASSGRVLAWVNHVEGLLEFYGGRPVNARGKWERARALAGAFGSVDVVSLSSAWLAFAAYLEEDLLRFDKDGLTAIEAIRKGNNGAITRMALTLGLCFHFAGDLHRASENYKVSKLAANEEGDEVALAALIHDMAWMNGAWRRNASLSPIYRNGSGEGLRTSAQSATSFEDLVGVSTAPSLAPLLLAQDDILSANWQAAVTRISAGLDGAEGDGFGRLRPGLFADRAFCLAQMGELERAHGDVLFAVRLSEGGELHGDDRAVLLSRLSATCRLLGLADEARTYAESADAAWLDVLAFGRELHKVANRLDLALRAALKPAS